MRLDKLLEGTKVGSRSQVKKLIKAQGVWVDHMPARNGRQNVDPGLQLIEVTGQRVTHPKHSYIILNKPSGVVSAKKDTNYLTVIDQLAEEDKVQTCILLADWIEIPKGWFYSLIMVP